MRETLSTPTTPMAPSARSRSLATRWLGVGLASVVAVVTIGLALTGRLALYIAPDSAWFAVGMAVVVLVGAIASFTLPLGAESHGHADDANGHDHDHGPQTPVAATATAVGGLTASGIVLLTLVLPPASLSAELAMSRDVGAPPLFAGADIQLATTGDTSEFGIGEWSAVFATATNPDAFDGSPVTLTGFVTPGGGDFQLTRLVITHCVIDAQTAGIPVSAGDVPDTGQWVTVTGTVRSGSDGSLVLDAASVDAIDEPADPYEY